MKNSHIKITKSRSRLLSSIIISLDYMPFSLPWSGSSCAIGLRNCCLSQLQLQQFVRSFVFSTDKKAQDKKSQQFFCPKCVKIYGAKSNLARHCISAHRWSLTLSAPIMDHEKHDLFDTEPDKGASQSSVQEKSNKAESRSAEVDAA